MCLYTFGSYSIAKVLVAEFSACEKSGKPAIQVTLIAGGGLNKVITFDTEKERDAAVAKARGEPPPGDSESSESQEKKDLRASLKALPPSELDKLFGSMGFVPTKPVSVPEHIESKGEKDRDPMPADLKVVPKQKDQIPAKRNQKSASILNKMAVPRVFPGPEVEVQEIIVEGLEREICELPADEQKEVYFLGGIELADSKVGTLKELISNAKLINLEDAAIKESAFPLAQKAELGESIITNTLSTMEEAGQLEYLRESNLIDGDWKVIVEIHYYRDRKLGQTKLHKDTRGQTLFVNLNYVNEEPIPGAEYIVNPATNPEHERYVREHLPPVFVKDLAKVKKHQGDPKEIGSSNIPANSVVAFVDELIHHKTPTMGHRTITSGGLKFQLQKKVKEEFEEAEAAYKKFNKNRAGKLTKKRPLSYYLKKAKVKESDVSAWSKLMPALDDATKTFNRKELSDILPNSKFLNIDELIEMGGEGDFGQAYMIYIQDAAIPVKKPGTPPLIRQRSEELLRGEAIKQEGNRTFFRTWIRAERK